MMEYYKPVFKVKYSHNSKKRYSGICTHRGKSERAKFGFPSSSTLQKVRTLLYG